MRYQEEFEIYKKTGDVELRNQLVEKHLYIVDVLIKRYEGKGIDREDIYQVGAMALILAVDRFDPSYGYEFATFATPTILGEIKRYFRDKGWAMKVPRRLKEIAGNLPKAKEKLMARLNRTPTTKELAEEMGLTEEEIIEAMDSSLAYETNSINQAFEQDEEGLVYEKHMAKGEKGYDFVESKDIIEKVLAQLTDSYRYIFKKRFIDELSQKQIADELGVSQMTISRTENKLRELIKTAMQE